MYNKRKFKFTKVAEKLMIYRCFADFYAFSCDLHHKLGIHAADDVAQAGCFLEIEASGSFFHLAF